MARTFDEPFGGPGIASLDLINNIIELDPKINYVLFYKSKNHLGKYKDYPNVKEIFMKMPNKFLWDQIAVPYNSWKENVDLIFNPKFTVPLLTRKLTLVLCQGMEYFSFPQYYSFFSLMYVRIFFPLYYKKAQKVLTLSNDEQNDLNKYIKVPYEKMETVYSAHSKDFFPRRDRKELEAIKQKYHLPENFILSVAKPFQGDRLLPRKNIDNIVRSFLAFEDNSKTLKLVLADNRSYEYITEVFGKEFANDPRFVYPGWISHEDMPYIYSLAKLLMMPSYSESFGLPLVEAMACGCPVITSTTSCCPEIVGDAGIVVDPTDVKGLTFAISSILTDQELSQRLTEKGIKKASEYSWTNSAKKVIRIFNELIEDQSYTSEN
jgi:glycosyltransferase involved in cell wall biosynthesis